MAESVERVTPDSAAAVYQSIQSNHWDSVDIKQISNAFKNSIFIAEQPRSKTWDVDKKTKLKSLLFVLNIIDLKRDAKFDPNDMPLLNVAPPDGSGLDSGMDPDQIKDPILKKEYLDAIEKNHVKAENYNFQSGLISKREEVIQYVVSYVKRSFSSGEMADVKDLIEAQLKNDPFRNEIAKKIGNVGVLP